MGASQRRKGRRGEYEALDLLARCGVRGERILEQFRKGQLPDLDTDVGLIEVKRRGPDAFKQLYRWLENADVVMLRADRKRWLVVMDAEAFFAYQCDVSSERTKRWRRERARKRDGKGDRTSGVAERSTRPLSASREGKKEWRNRTW